ncbi:hypothetical protein FRA_33c05340 [Francisella sp. W12-1067]|nr:hypothetical protein FRA_33c05340 [Francisella sp. W12-1067]
MSIWRIFLTQLETYNFSLQQSLYKEFTNSLSFLLHAANTGPNNDYKN